MPFGGKRFTNNIITAFQIVCILTAIGLFIPARAYRPLMAGGLLLLGMACFVRWGYEGRFLRPTKLDWPLSLFLLSGVISLWVSYDVWGSLAKLGLILAGLTLYYTLSQAGLRIRLYSAAGLVLFAVVVALYYIGQQIDWAGVGASKLSGLYRPHENEVAGVLEVAFLLGVGLVAIHCWPSGLSATLAEMRAGAIDRLTLTWLGVALVIIVFGLLLTGSRGAWLAVGIAVLGWSLPKMKQTARLRLLDTIALVTILGAVLLLLLLLLNRSSGLPFSWRESDITRLELYRGAGRLGLDYLFTGSGLGTFPMLYSAYVLGLDVIFLSHAHNLYLAVWLEQGAAGLIALLWLGLAFFQAYRRRRPAEADLAAPVNPRATAAQATLATACSWAMAAIFIHGLVDSVHYNSASLPLIFVPLGLAGFVAYPEANRPDMGISRLKAGLGRNLALATIVLLGLLIAGRDGVLARWYANLGAVAQSKIELSDYQWPDRIPSKVRARADLSRPIRLFKQALVLAPGNVTARERLALINSATP